MRAEIDRWNDLIYRTVNNGVHRAGFASAQDKYDKAARRREPQLEKAIELAARRG